MVCINFLDFNLFKDGKYRHSCFVLRDLGQPGIVLNDHLMIHFIEMKKVGHDGLVAWMRLFEILEEGRPMTEEDRKFVAANPVFSQLRTEFDSCLQDEEAREIALSREKFHRDQVSRENSAHRRGLAEGEARGKLKGKLEGKLEDARRLLELCVDMEIVIKATDLSREQIEAGLKPT